ncbi:hypothetical protein KUTeg_019681 [Tegillarca granosa]|uniref:Uncharacterized protein n=1 Tax=Tegillarca granosa TaxID=220873 RepID=A0ABQ9EIR8_TEGGR|nr:hypothetical protein KUTeg_019681 [Tegillarca granosa]
MPDSRVFVTLMEIAELSNLIPEAKKLATRALGPKGIDRDMLATMKKDIYPRTVRENSKL